MEPQYPIRTAAKLTSLSLDTLRAWERRYSAVVPHRTDRGRLYSKDQVARLILLRRLVEQGHAIGQIAALGTPELQALLTTEPVAEAAPAKTSKLVTQLADWFAAFDDIRANQELGRLAIVTQPRELVMDVLLPLARETGNRWERGEIGVAQEHLVSGAMRNMLGSLLRIHPPLPGAPRMVFATLAGELHDLGILAAAMLAAAAGWSPLFLGPNLPAVEIAAAARKTSPAVVVIGNSGQRTTASAVRDLASLLPPDIALWIGGPAPGETQSVLPDAVVVIPGMAEFENACFEAIR